MSNAPGTAATGGMAAATTSTTLTYTSATGAYEVHRPESWSVLMQDGNTISISPESGMMRVTGFLIAPVPNPMISPEDDLRAALMPTMSSTTTFMPTGPIMPTTVGGEPGYRAPIHVTLAGTPSASTTYSTAPAGGTNTTYSASPAGSTSTTSYTGSLLATSHKGVNYQIGVFARDGDTATLMQAEQILASLRFL